jgi:hypothetical protein
MSIASAIPTTTQTPSFILFMHLPPTLRSKRI